MHIIRFVPPDSDDVRIGVLEDGTVNEIAVASLGELLHLPVNDLRDTCAQTEGATFDIGDVMIKAPIDQLTEMWCAGVTYKTSQYERMKESESAADIYERIYSAERPEIFFKSVAWRVVGDGEQIGARADSVVDVPEPELALVINAAGEIVGYSICNDVSSRTIEGENPLYLPQAKMYSGSCALGFGIRPTWEILDPMNLEIKMDISRGGKSVWSGSASTAQLNRSLADLVSYLFRANTFPDGAILSTGTSLVPSLPFTLNDGDAVRIDISDVGTLTNRVVRGALPIPPR